MDKYYLNFFLVCILLSAMLIIFFSLLIKNRDSKSNICIDDFLLGEDGRASKSASVMYWALVISTWVLVYVTINYDVLIPVCYTTFLAACFAPILSKILKGEK